MTRSGIERKALLKSKNKKWPQKISYSEKGMVSTQKSMATAVGVEMLSEGGNAIDAAVASAFALGVCEPMSSGLGGQSLMTIHIAENNMTKAIDGSSRAPSGLNIDLLNKKRLRWKGHRATTVPTTPRVLDYVLKKYGTLPLNRILEPSIRLAEEGYEISELQNFLQRREEENWLKGNAAKLFLKEGNVPYSVGEIFKQPQLAQTLRRLARYGVDDFYSGEIAKAIHSDMQNNKGFLTYDDLINTPYPIEREPLSYQFNGLKLYTFPPPGDGSTLINILKRFKDIDINDFSFDKIEDLMKFIEIVEDIQIKRKVRPRHPDHASSDEKKLVSSQSTNINSDTTHLSTMDIMGNCVSLTQSIEKVYGAFVVSPELGFLYNNYLSTYDVKDPHHPFHLRPNAIPWTTVAPTIMFKDGKPDTVIGSPGSERISSIIVQVLLRMLNQNPLESVTSPRMFCSYKRKVSLEASRLRNDFIELLIEKGYEIDRRPPFSFFLGSVQLVTKKNENFIGIADVRRDGSACGPK